MGIVAHEILHAKAWFSENRRSGEQNDSTRWSQAPRNDTLVDFWEHEQQLLSPAQWAFDLKSSRENS